ncbi:TolC family protein [Flavobacterium stagni]|uniref:TolC family protein n=1 Tax=Flavobacterium stagni TaxID=2506421 RepID=A0A4Q1KAV0_9FLAO|nr:TolC family protein [Flavobacterium stagni]RXR23065.1 TolC family protein [Flavobacterium stagni]
MQRYTVFLFVLFGLQLSSAQQLLTLEEAIKIALENNFDIQLAKNNLKIDETNNYIGNAGMLPNVSANITDTNSRTNTTQVQGGTERTLNGAKNLNLNYGVSLDWTVFDGLKMFARKEQLNKLEQQGQAELKSAILSKISAVYLAYYDLVQQQQQIKALDTTIVISKERLQTAQNRYSIGKAAKLEVLNAQVDLNTDESLLIQQKEQFKASQIQLNTLLARDVALEFSVLNALEVDDRLVLDDLKNLAKSQNPQLQAQVLNKNIAELQLKQVKAGRYPTVKVNTGYTIGRTEASLGFITQSQSRGLTYGFSASVPIFQGSQISRNEKIAKLQVTNAEITIKQQELLLESQLQSAFASYLSNKKLVEMEAKNVSIAEQNLDITLAKFKIGTITPVEFRTAQQGFIEAKVRYSNALYQTKIYEISLKELAGSLTF